MHGIDEYEIWMINYKKMLGFSPFLFVIVVSIHPMLLYMCCRCPCTLTSFLGYVNRFCMIANSHFCKSYVIMIFSWKCLEETLLIGNLFSKVSIYWWEALSFWVLFSASWRSECSYCRNYLSSVLIQELFLTWDHDDLSLRAKASFQSIIFFLLIRNDKFVVDNLRWPYLWKRMLVYTNFSLVFTFQLIVCSRKHESIYKTPT